MSDGGGPPPVEVRGLVKRYGELTAVAGVDLTVELGRRVRLSGPERRRQDHLAADDARPDPADGGHACGCSGRDPTVTVRALAGRRRVRRGADLLPVPERPPEPRAAGGVRRRRGASERIDRSLELVELADRAGDRVGGYSHGMRQRLGIAAALLRDPELLLLDEPTTGLDPGGMRDMRELIRRLAGEGITIVLSSHLLTEVEEVCNRVAIVRTGQDRVRGRDRGAEARRRRPRTRCRRPTTSGRSRCAGRSRGSPTSRARTARSRIAFTADRGRGRRRCPRRWSRRGR